MTLNANDFQKQVTEQLRKCKDVEEKFKTKIKAFTVSLCKCIHTGCIGTPEELLFQEDSGNQLF